MWEEEEGERSSVFGIVAFLSVCSVGLRSICE